MKTSLRIWLTIVFTTLSYTCTEVVAQEYVTRKYATVVERDVVYGTAQGFAGTTDTLRLNYYKPQGDGNRRRPLALWVHGGGFTGGNRTDFDILAQAYAERGYVSATISYRLGFYTPAGLAYPFTYDSAEVVRANYRAAQDMYGALRYIMRRSTADSIDPSFAVIGGASAGGMTVLQAAYIDDNERYPATHGAPDVPGVAFPQRGELGPATGTLNTDVPTPRILAVVNMFGAIQDTSFINGPQDPALYQYHQTGDPIVPCYYGHAYWSYASVPDNYFYMHGSCDIKERFDHLGFSADRHKSWLYNGAVHGFHDPVALDLAIAQYLAPLVSSAVTDVAADPADDSRALTERFHESTERFSGSTEHSGASGVHERVTVVDMSGRIVFQAPSTSDAPSTQLDEVLQNLPNGCYLAHVGVETRLFMVLR